MVYNIISAAYSIIGANKVSIGENVYKSLDPNTQNQFREILLPDNRWKYINYGTDKPYKVFTSMRYKETVGDSKEKKAGFLYFFSF